VSESARVSPWARRTADLKFSRVETPTGEVVEVEETSTADPAEAIAAAPQPLSQGRADATAMKLTISIVRLTFFSPDP
jgi:hypothetical protein